MRAITFILVAVVTLAAVAELSSAQVAFGVWNKQFGKCHPSAVAAKLDETFWGEGDAVQVAESFNDCAARAASFPGVDKDGATDAADQVVFSLLKDVQKSQISKPEFINRLWFLLRENSRGYNPAVGRSLLAFGSKSMCLVFRAMRTEPKAWVSFVELVSEAHASKDQLPARWGNIWQMQLELQLVRAQVAGDTKFAAKIEALLKSQFPNAPAIKAVSGGNWFGLANSFIDNLYTAIYEGRQPSRVVNNALSKARAGDTDEYIERLSKEFRQC